MLNIFKYRNGLNIIPRPDGNTAPNSMGDLAVYSVDGKIYYYDGTIISPLVTEAGPATLTNKTFDAGSNSVNNIRDANIAADAAIAFSKLAPLASANILIGNASNIVTPFPVTGDISLSNTGVTAYVGVVPTNKGGTGVAAGSPNATFNALSPMTTVGDIIYEDATPVAVRLPIGTSGQVLTVTGGIPAWVTPSPGFANPMTSVGDMIIGGSGGSPQRLAATTNGFILTLVGGSPAWQANSGGGGTVTNVTASSPLASSGGTTPNISFTGVLGPAFGGTGVSNNAASTITLNGNFPLNLMLSASTSITLPTAGTLSTLSGSETLSNKTFSDAITMNQIATPSSPAAGTDKIYFKADGNAYILNTNGTESILTSSLPSARAAIGLTSNYTSSGGASNPIKYDTVEYDNTNSYSISTGIYTIPYTGDYKVSATFYTLSGSQNFQLYKNGVGYIYILRATETGTGTLSLPCNKGDTLSVSPDGSATFDGNVPFVNYLSIEQLGNSGGGSIVTPFFQSSACTTSSSVITSGSFTTYSNSPTLTLTPNVTGTYRVYSSFPTEYLGNGNGISRILATSGSPTLLAENQSTNGYGGSNTTDSIIPSVVESIYTLTSGVSYSFDIQGLNSGGTEILNRGDTAQFYIFAELISNQQGISSNPMTSVGDIIIGGTNGIATRLPIGTSTQVLTVSGGTAVWAAAGGGGSGLDFFASSQVTTDSSTLSGPSFATFSNDPTFNFTPNFTGTYEVYCSAPLESLTSGGAYVRIHNTVGSATLLNEQPASIFNPSGGNLITSLYTSSIYTLTASTSYTFVLQGKIDSSNTAALKGILTPFYVFARRIG